MHFLFKYLSQITEINEIINKNTGLIRNTTDDFNVNLLATDFLHQEKSLFVVLPNLYQAQKYYDKLVNLNIENVLFYPASELITAEMLISSNEFLFERINTIKGLLTNKKSLVVTHLSGAIRYQLHHQKWQDNFLTIQKNKEYDIDSLLRYLVSMGYKRTYTVENIGEFSVRGNIIDIFPVDTKNPYRLDFFDTELEKIKVFNINTQLSFKELEHFLLMPINELFYTDEELAVALKNIDDFIINHNLSNLEIEKIQSDRMRLENHDSIESLSRYMDFFPFDKQSILDFSNNKKIYFIDKPKMNSIYEKMIEDIKEYFESIKGYNFLKLNFFMELNFLFNQYKHLEIEGLNSLINSQSINALYVKEPNQYFGNIEAIKIDFKRYINQKTVLVVMQNEERINSLKELFKDQNIDYQIVSDETLISNKLINIIHDFHLYGFELVQKNLIIFAENNIFKITNQNVKVKYKSVFNEGKKISSLNELKEGDYIVHYDYGIGRYLGLITMELSGKKRDYIHILYSDDDKIYVPIENFNLIQKYSGTENTTPKLTKIGTAQWARTKQRVKEKVNEISEKLIRLYAMRNQAKGFMFAKDDHNQAIFESKFAYEETRDQIKAIRAVKNDMESLRPMDRLICGDVGYGKTEIALRASFKAVMNNKQVAYLAPTTVLARQHYHTFKARFEEFGANIELVSRFVSAAKVKEIIKNLELGKIDIIIGTHRLLSNDIVFKDLGLLIIDEEQRFGVIHKERIKEMKVNVDTLTLTATPIPRTLQMSIMGIKDLSLIETPPKNRYPVQTYVLEQNTFIIKEAIEREIARGGQVFYLYNRVEDIELMALKINNLVPEAKVCFAHGKMDKNSLEEILVSFIDKEFDVLVCTTIIETGIDIPNSNTLIIHEADRLGLSQLYQIRGRVGRSDKIAYAYLMYQKNKKLNEIAQQRLSVIKEYSELGSGFKIAMRDLSIRGAGDILGDEQSGFIDSVGFDLYMKILEETIKEKQGHKKIEEPVTELSQVMSNRHINTKYIENDDVKIKMHQKIDALSSMKELEKLKHELLDRFGNIDEDLNEYMFEKLFKNLCKKLDVEKIINENNLITVIISEKHSNKIDGEHLFLCASEISDEIRFSYIRKKIHITLKTTALKSNSLKIYCLFLEKIL